MTTRPIVGRFRRPVDRAEAATRHTARSWDGPEKRVGSTATGFAPTAMSAHPPKEGTTEKLERKWQILDEIPPRETLRFLTETP